MDFWLIIITGFTAIISVSLYGLFADPLPFSLNKVFWVFNLMFMGIAPLLQFLSHTYPFPWIRNQHDHLSFVYTNCIILACQIVYLFVRRRLAVKEATTCPHYPEQWLHRYRRQGTMIYIAVILLQVMLSGNLWSRRMAEETTVIANSSLQLFADKSLKGLVLYFCLISIRLYHQKAISGRHLLLVLTAGMVSNFPTAIPRYWLAAFYLGILISVYREYFIKKVQLFSIMLITGLIILFPLLSLMRLNKTVTRHYFEREGTIKSYLMLYKDSFCGQDFDAYASFRNTILYVQANGLRGGRQIGTTLLFFIPRTIWPGKSIGSGAIVNPPKPHSDFNNYSSPLIAEGYIDFGITGSLIFIATFAWLGRRYDALYWQGARSSFAGLLYPACLGMAFFMLRGDLLSSFAYTTGILLSGYIFHYSLGVRSMNT